MAASIFNNPTRGLVTIRNALKTAFASFIGVTDDNVAFAANQVRLNPTQAATSNLIKAATITDVNDTTFDATITINGTTEFTGKQIWAIGPCTSAAATDAQGRLVRTLSIGVQAGDTQTVGLRIAAQDAS